MTLNNTSIELGKVQHIAAFADGCSGGNAAGVYLADTMPSEEDMRALAAKLGYSETVFAVPELADSSYRVRYFSPESEVPFCGHATIALGKALGQQAGEGVFQLQLNEAQISVEVSDINGFQTVALQSPPTHSSSADPDLLTEALALFSLSTADLDPRFPPARAHAGADHLLLMLNSREGVAAMHYDLEVGRQWMNKHGLVTVLLGYVESDQFFHTRNAFASGGVLEDPATGAATAALAGYLRDINWSHGGEIDVVQGEDMGQRSLLRAQFSDEAGSSIRVSGSARVM
jgi:PhzF family phenazine biosynthesis protein